MPPRNQYGRGAVFVDQTSWRSGFVDLDGRAVAVAIVVVVGGCIVDQGSAAYAVHCPGYTGLVLPDVTGGNAALARRVPRRVRGAGSAAAKAS